MVGNKEDIRVESALLCLKCIQGQMQYNMNRGVLLLTPDTIW